SVLSVLLAQRLGQRAWLPGADSPPPASSGVLFQAPAHRVGSFVADAQAEEDAIRPSGAQLLFAGQIVFIDLIGAPLDVQGQRLALVLRHHLVPDVATVNLFRDPGDLFT